MREPARPLRRCLTAALCALIAAVTLVVALPSAATATPVYHEVKVWVVSGYDDWDNMVNWGYYDDAHAPYCVDTVNCYDHWHPTWVDTSHWDTSGSYYTYSPDNTEPPQISGVARSSRTLTATQGTWTNDAANGDPTNSYAYEWQRCDAAGANCTAIGSSSTYTLTDDDIDSTVRVAVTASNASGSNTAASAPTTLVTVNQATNTEQPSVSGTLTDGQQVAADPGTWVATDDLSYQWYRCDTDGDNCQPIPGATGDSYTLTPDDVDATLRVEVTGSNDQTSATAASPVTAQIDPLAPSNTTAPVLSGIAQDAHTLTVDDGAWTGTPTLTYTYAWERCDAAGTNCAPISGATQPTYTLTPDDVDGTVRAVVTATNAGGAQTAASAPTAMIAVDPPNNTTAGSISGTLADQSTLTADPGAWTGTPALDYAYVWQRCDADGANCADIAAATGPQYTLTAEDVGHAIQATLTVSNRAGDETVTLRPSAAGGGAGGPVAPIAPTNMSTPTVGGGTVQGGQALATSGTWNGTPHIALAYSWHRCDAAGANCVPVPVIDAVYPLTVADAGHRLRVTVTATNAAGTTAKQSPPAQLISGIAPKNTGRPMISGTTRVGEVLAAVNGGWTGSEPISYAYQWQSCDESGDDCQTIAGATAATLTLTDAQLGRTIRVQVTARNVAGETAAMSALAGASSPTADDGTVVLERIKDGSTTGPKANHRPTAQAVVIVGERGRVVLDGSSSFDEDGMIVSYRWTVGEKIIGRSAKVTRKTTKQAYKATLTVTDSEGATGRDTVTVKPGSVQSRRVRVTFSDAVLFATDSAALTRRSKGMLRRLRPTLRKSSVGIVAGYTDSRGSAAYNKRLSHKRAAAVRKQLRRVCGKRCPKLKLRAHGERHPKATNRTAAGRAKNRRVVITLKVR